MTVYTRPVSPGRRRFLLAALGLVSILAVVA